MRAIKGRNIIEAELEINRYKKAKEEKSRDSKARETVLQMLINSIVNGYTEEDAIENVMKQPVIKELEYIGDLRKAFKNLINTRKVKAIINKRINAKNIKCEENER